MRKSMNALIASSCPFSLLITPIIPKIILRFSIPSLINCDLLSEKLFALDGSAFAKEIGEDSWSENGFFSVDNFLYARGCAVANGADFYEKALKSPAEMPKDLTFEAILYIASTAFERKTGRKWDYAPAFPIETFSNAAGWKNRK